MRTRPVECNLAATAGSALALPQRVRVSLLHNPSAGDGAPFEEVVRELRRAGYEVVREIAKRSDFERVCEEPVDFVVVAGGDGTLREAARALACSRVPLAILPIGTANNVAKSLGIEGTVAENVARWKNARRVPFDLGVARGQWGESRFLESVGGGLIPAGIETAQEHPAHKTEDTQTELERAIGSYAEALDRLRPRPWTGTVDDRPIDGEFLLIEILNIPSVGANLVLAGHADPSDGYFDVVTAGEAERDAIADYLDSLREGRQALLSLPVRRARRVEIAGWDRMHVDDEVRRIAEAGKVTIEVEPGAVEILVGSMNS
jgi:diacylglycerol kinase family enzyme